MPDLEQRAYSVVAESISAANVGELIHWLSARIPSNGFTFGSNIPGAPPITATDGWDTAPAMYGEWSTRLRHEVLDFLLRALPAQLMADGTPLHTNPHLLTAYAPLPFDLFKQVVESPELPISFIQDRFGFAKRAITQRKKLAQTQGGAGTPPGAQMEESVVLALKDDGDGMSVHITRKPKRSRAALWKTEG